MTIATGEPAGSTITTEPTRLSRICRATETALASGVAVTTPAVMISLSCTPRTLPPYGAETAAHAGRPARGGRRARQPALPRLRRAALRLDRPAPRAGRAGEPLRELRPGRRRRAGRAPRRRCASSTGSADRGGRDDRRPRRLLAPGSAAPAGPAWSAAPLPVHGRGGAPPRRPPRPGRQVRPLVAPAAGIATMWQTILNGFTFGRNVALGGASDAPPPYRPAALAAPPRRR